MALEHEYLYMHVLVIFLVSVFFPFKIMNDSFFMFPMMIVHAWLASLPQVAMWVTWDTELYTYIDDNAWGHLRKM